jgi:hypothetical protein
MQDREICEKRGMSETGKKARATDRAIRACCARFASSLAETLPVERRLLARRGWAGEKLVFLNSLRWLLNRSVSIRAL